MPPQRILSSLYVKFKEKHWKTWAWLKNIIYKITLSSATACILIWPRLWNFRRRQLKFNRLLHPNEHPERICLYLEKKFFSEKQLVEELSKVEHFQISKSIFMIKCKFIFLKSIFSYEYWIRRTTFIISIYIFHHSHKTLFSKNVPYFCCLVIKLSYMIQKNPFRMFIWMQKSIEFQPPPHEIPQT